MDVDGMGSIYRHIAEHMKGTTTVGLSCSDGVVIGSDTRVSMGTFIFNSEMKKIFRIDDSLGITVAGSLGDADELVRMLKAHNEIYKMNENKPLSPKSAASLLSIILQQNKYMPLLVQLIVAGIDGDQPQLYSLDPWGGVTSDSKFTSTGSGSLTALGYLEDVYRKGMSTKEAVREAAKALSIAMRRDSATGDNMAIATITKAGYTEIPEKDVLKLLAK